MVTTQAHQNTRAWSQNLDYHKRQQLTADGCHCNSTFVNINGTSKSSYQNYMGLYHFEAMHQVFFFFLAKIQNNAMNILFGTIQYKRN